MYIKDDLTKVKRTLEQSIGSKVKLKSSKGRQKHYDKEGILEKVYPSIFIIKLLEGSQSSIGRRESYSYTDILTRSIELTLYE